MASVFNKKTQFGNKQFGGNEARLHFCRGCKSADGLIARDKKAARRISCKKRGKMTLKDKFAGMKIEMCKVDEER